MKRKHGQDVAQVPEKHCRQVAFGDIGVRIETIPGTTGIHLSSIDFEKSIRDPERYKYLGTIDKTEDLDEVQTSLGYTVKFLTDRDPRKELTNEIKEGDQERA